MEMLLSLAVALTAGLMMTRLLKLLHINLPDVTGYLLAGLLIGPYGLGALKIPGVGFASAEAVASMNMVSQTALGFIAFAIGNEFRLRQLKKIGKQAVVVGIVQACIATLFVDVALVVLCFIMKDVISVPVALTLGAIAAATAPAATLMVVRQYKAKGKLTSILLPVVALDDAVGLVLFAVSFGIARAMSSGTVDVISILVNPLVEILLSLALGAALGALLTWLEKLFHSNSNRLSLTIAFVILTVAVSLIDFHVGPVHVSFSTLLVCMMLGTVFCNMCPLSADLMERADKWTAPLFTLFFVLSGAELELSVFTNLSIVIVGLVYIAFRSLGKYFGCYFSTSITKCDANVRKYLGITMLPQAGVALGMSITAQSLGTHEGSIVRNIILFSVLIYELFGPTLTKMALTRAGEIQPKSLEVLKRREIKLEKLSDKE